MSLLVCCDCCGRTRSLRTKEGDYAEWLHVRARPDERCGPDNPLIDRCPDCTTHTPGASPPRLPPRTPPPLITRVEAPGGGARGAYQRRRPTRPTTNDNHEE